MAPGTPSTGPQSASRVAPVTVFYDGSEYWLADGFHRAAASEGCQRTEIQADVRPGSRRDACLAAAGANATHGLRRSNADKRRAVVLLLQDEEWSQWSDREIARRCGVSHTFVSNLRAEPGGNGCQERLAYLEAVILADKRQASTLIDELTALGVTLTPTAATFPPGLPSESWKQAGVLLRQLHELVGEEGAG